MAILTEEQIPSKALKFHERRLALRMSLWPEIAASEVWNRKTAKGFTTIPRTMPLIQMIMDRLSNRKPVSSTYLDLWCRCFDEGFVNLDRPHEMAYAAGFTTGRGPHIWAERIRILKNLGFIKVAPGAQGALSFALILNPYHTLSKLRAADPENFTDAMWNALLSQVAAIGADDLDKDRKSLAKKSENPPLKTRKRLISLE